MDRIAHPLALHRVGEQAVGGDHDTRVGRLHRDDRLVEPPRLTDAQELHGRGDHPLGRVAPAVEDALRQRPVVDADAQRHAARAALLDERLQLAVLVAVIARVDAHLVDMLRSDGGHLGHEVDVGDQSRIAPLLAHASGDFAQVLRLAPPLGREPHDGRSGPGDREDLGHGGLGVVGVGVGHRLHGDGTVAADRGAADADLRGLAPPESGDVHGV